MDIEERLENGLMSKGYFEEYAQHLMRFTFTSTFE